MSLFQNFIERKFRFQISKLEHGINKLASLSCLILPQQTLDQSDIVIPYI